MGSINSYISEKHLSAEEGLLKAIQINMDSNPVPVGLGEVAG